MAIKLATNFALNSRQALDARNQYADAAALKAVTDAVMDDGHLAYCLADKKYYVYNSGNSVDATLGKWRELQTTVPGKGEANGVASLGSDGKVPASQLPSYVDDVLEFNEISTSLPTSPSPRIDDVDKVVFYKNGNGDTATRLFFGVKDNTYYTYWKSVKGDENLGMDKYMTNSIQGKPLSGKIYVDVSDNTSYRWSGTELVAIGGGSLVIGETTGTAFDGGKGKALEDKLNNQNTLVFSFLGQWVATADKVTNNTMRYRSMEKGVLSDEMHGAERPIPTATKTTAGVMTAADKGKLDAIGYVGYSLGINGNALSFTKVKADTTSEVQTVTLPSGGTADAALSAEDINGAITAAFS